MSTLESPIPLSDIELVLAWVDTYKLSRPTKKINRDFSDAVLLAEILNVHYPKLVEMHNYPPRNSQSLKLNNWLTLNRKVLRKLRLNLCTTTMEQLANSAPGVVERVLIMVRDKIRRDEEINKSMREADQNISSGGSYYEACGDDDNVLVVPLKARVNGVLEVIQKKVVSHETYLTLREEMKDIQETVDTLKQKVEHLENLLKLKEERIDELQKQLERKAARRKEVEALQNSLAVPFERPPSPDINEVTPVPSKPLIKSDSVKWNKEESKIPILIDKSRTSVEDDKPDKVKSRTNIEDDKLDKVKSVTSLEGDKLDKVKSRTNIEDDKLDKVKSITSLEDDKLDRVKSDVFKEVEIVDEVNLDGFHDTEDYNEVKNMTIEDTIEKEINEIYQTNFVLNLHA